MSKKHHHPGGPQTGKEFISLAEHRGAHTEKSGNFIAVETPKGKVYVVPSDKTMDKQTRGNLRKWFRLLGLMAFPTICLVLAIVRSL